LNLPPPPQFFNNNNNLKKLKLKNTWKNLRLQQSQRTAQPRAGVVSWRVGFLGGS